jgi:hypothetical protein
MLGFDESKIVSDLKLISTIGFIQIMIQSDPAAKRRLKAVTQPALLPATNVRTNETDVTDSARLRAYSHPLAEIWNSNRGALPEVRGCTGKRKKAADARWTAKPEPDYWRAVVKRMAASEFCRGLKNKPGSHESWKADFDFFVGPDTHFKVLEGKYDNAADSSKPVAAAPLRDYAAILGGSK